MRTQIFSGSLRVTVITQHIWRRGVSRIANPLRGQVPAYIWRRITAIPREPIFLHSKYSLLACLLAAMLLSGCGAAKTPAALPGASNVQDLAVTKTPCVNISVSNAAPKVGETIGVVGTLVGIVNPNYIGLEIKDQDADDSSMMINLMSKPPLKAAPVSNILKMVSADYSDGKAVIGLEAIKAGVTEVDYFVSAENFCGAPLGNGVSPKIKITVNP